MRKTLSAVLFATVAASAFSFAQTATAPSIATIVEHRVARLTTSLSLTTAQQTQATAIFTNVLTADAANRTSLDTARSALKAAVKANNISVINQTATSIGTLTGQITATDSLADAAFYALLTADQKTKFDAVGDSTGGGRGRFGGPGGRGR
jgi:Spy/CpxP family protein refolding chaperone